MPYPIEGEVRNLRSLEKPQWISINNSLGLFKGVFPRG